MGGVNDGQQGFLPYNKNNYIIMKTKKDKEKLECILRSLFTFWNNPNLEDYLEKARNFNTLKLIKIGQCHTEGIYLVNGDIVKEKSFRDFVEGGNDAVYGKKDGKVAQFIPDHQIWLDANEDINCIPYICLHELIERYFMIEHKFKYDDAHEVANDHEMRARKHNIFETRRNILKFPRVQQPDSDSCGHACIAMILQYFELREKVGDLEKFPLSKKDVNGLEPDSIVTILEEFKIKSSIKRDLTFDEIKELIDKKRPLIIELQAYTDKKEDLIKSYENGHYIVAIGYTLEYLIFADPSSYFKTYLKFEELLSRWHDIDNGKKNEKLAIVIDSIPKEMEFDTEKTVKQAKRAK